ncbi:uncharacterized protein BXZ73DRAFT_76201 [Epithele typhae]|uniref:uncharacterized protein n=1 Tax=Epithele typhae TaxID=378194 RepID=UPI002007982E|nr:uncharacterized protein BXZ73DRAFT_76201 [Epithele typhae]KAH9939055.1 hypothetical protein BXZ73DRAFT_76201 [Epithele typhae]
MSSADDAEAIQEFSEFLIQGYCATVVTVLVMYEYLVTLSDEVEYFWKRKFSGASILFFANRYITLAYLLFSLASSWVPLSDAGCAAAAQADEALDVAQYLPWAVSILIFLLSMVPFGINMVEVVETSGVILPDLGCVGTSSVSDALGLNLTIASRSCLMAADVLLVLVTWHELWGNQKLTRLFQRDTFANVLLRDGTIYFIVLLIMNALHLAFTLMAIDQPGTTVSYVTIFTDPLTSILVSRFLLRLQSINRRSVQTTSLFSDTPVNTIMFNRVVGSLGSSVTRTGGAEDHTHYDPTWAEDRPSDDGVQSKRQLDAVFGRHSTSPAEAIELRPVQSP